MKGGAILVMEFSIRLPLKPGTALRMVPELLGPSQDVMLHEEKSRR
jgi:hypothetical protein